MMSDWHGVSPTHSGGAGKDVSWHEATHEPHDAGPLRTTPGLSATKNTFGQQRFWFTGKEQDRSDDIRDECKP